jgi:hypothetical protein
MGDRRLLGLVTRTLEVIVRGRRDGVYTRATQRYLVQMVWAASRCVLEPISPRGPFEQSGVLWRGV